jgi:hypothetical protein
MTIGILRHGWEDVNRVDVAQLWTVEDMVLNFRIP